MQMVSVLALNKLELKEMINSEIVENPVLEESGDITEDETPQREEVEAAPEAPVNGDGLDHEKSMENIDLDAYFGDYWEGPGASSMMEEREEPPIENSLRREADLYDHLLWQLHMAEVTPRQREIVELIIGNLTPDGFLVATVEEIQGMGELEERGYTLEEIEEAPGPSQ